MCASLVVNLARAGADVIELGIPYSDPLADGPVIQAASQRALESGVTPLFVMDVVALVRRESDVPIVLMTYYNPVLRRGLARFADEATKAGADGVILTDLPPDEARPWLAEADRTGMATQFLLAPTSNDDRIRLVASHMKRGFVYCVSRTGVTGARSDVPADLSSLMDRIRAATELPICVGFGVSTPEHVARIAAIADGAVIGSALVDFLSRNSSSATLDFDLNAIVSDWKKATRRS